MKLLPNIEGEYGVSCRDCRYSRKHGAAKHAAKSAARKHAFQYAGHRVRVTQTVTIMEWDHPGQQQIADQPPY